MSSHIENHSSLSKNESQVPANFMRRHKRALGIGGVSVLAVGVSAGITMSIVEKFKTDTSSSVIDTDPSNNGGILPTDTFESNSPVPTISPSEVPTFTETSVPVPIETSAEEIPVIEQNEYGLSTAEYQKLIDSYSISLPETATPEEVYAEAFNIINNYYAAGHTKGEYDKNKEWVSLSDPMNTTGWNKWSAQLNTEAITEGLFGENQKTSELSVIDNLYNNKIEINRLWINTVRESQTPYVFESDFTPESITTSANPLDYKGVGTLTYSDNAAESAVASADSRAVFEKTYNNTAVNVTFNVEKQKWVVYDLYLAQ